VPIHDYTCARCGHLIEVIHGIHEGGPRFCPSCGAEGTMRRGFSAPAVHFKGSGWAKKDRSATSSAGKSRTSKSGDEAAAASSAPGGGGGEASTSTANSSSTGSGSATASSATADGGD
jgi:putative FmdB family regulatory protein